MIEIVMDKQSRADAGNQPEREEDSDRETSISDGFAKELVKLFKLLSDETRLRILFALMQDEELHVRALCELLDQSQPAVSHHLALLRVAGLIDRRREGKHNYYRLLSGRFEELLRKAFVNFADGRPKLQFKDFVFSYTAA